MKGRPLILVSLLVLALFAAACTSLPKASEPAPFDVSAHTTNPVELSADGPARNSDPMTLVSDFLLACAAGANDDFATARLFLSSDSSQRWHPEQQVLIYDTASRPTLTLSSPAGENTAEVSISAVPVASLDASGVLSRAESSQISQTLSLVKESGQWRISAPQDSFIVSKASFLASYERVNLYFPAHSGDALIADPRWLPSRRLASHLIEGLVEGPSNAVADAVSNAIPAGTIVPSAPVEVTDRIAKVHVEGPVPPEGTARDLLVWQITSTLEQSPSITQVEILVSDVELKDAAPLKDPSYLLDTRLGMLSGAIGTLNATKLMSLPLSTPPAEGARHPSMSPVDRGLFAWREGEELVVERIEEDATQVRVSVGGGGAPSIDRFGWTWSAKGGGLAAVSSQGEVLEISGFDPSPLFSRVAVSPDGARALLIGADHSDKSLMIATIVRDRQGKPTSLSSLSVIEGIVSMVEDASWAGTDAFVVLRRKQNEDGTGSAELAEVQLGGFLTASSAPEGAEEISAGSGPGNVCTRTHTGTLHCRSGALWQDMPSGLVDIRYPG